MHEIHMHSYVYIYMFCMLYFKRLSYTKWYAKSMHTHKKHIKLNILEYLHWSLRFSVKMILDKIIYNVNDV